MDAAMTNLRFIFMGVGDSVTQCAQNYIKMRVKNKQTDQGNFFMR